MKVLTKLIIVILIVGVIVAVASAPTVLSPGELKIEGSAPENLEDDFPRMKIYNLFVETGL